MTYSTSHLGIASMLLFLLSPRKFREWIKTHPRLFFATTLFAVLPDIDVLLPIPHRTWTHSIFVIFGVGILLLALSYISKNDKALTVSLLIFYFWITHVFFDLTWDSVGIFYPIDKSFYQITGGVILDLATQHVSVSGIYLKSTLQNPEKGINQYFVNWSAERRISEFGSSNLILIIPQLTVHLVLFLYYLVKVILPLLRSYKGFEKIAVDWSRLRLYRFSKLGWLSVLLTGLLAFSLYAGVGQGPTYTEDNSAGAGFYTLSDGLSLYSTIKYHVPSKSSATISFSFGTHALNFSMIFGASNSTMQNTAQSLIKDLSARIKDGNTTYMQFANEYMNFSDGIPSDWMEVKINPEESYKFSVDIPYTTEGQDYSFDFMLSNWNVSQYFIYSISTQITYTIHREEAVFTSNIIALLSGIGLIVLLVNSYIARKEVVLSEQNN